MLRTRAALVVGACASTIPLLVGSLPTSQATPTSSRHLQRLLQGADSGDFPGAEVPLGDADRTGPRLAALPSAKAAVAALGQGIQVSSYTSYGTPLSLLRQHGYLATGRTGSPAQIARTYLREHAAIWGLSAADVDGLQLVQNAPLSQSATAWSVSFNQKVHGLLVSQDGYVVVGLVKDASGGRIAGVTSSLVPTAVLGTLASVTPRLTVQQAVLAAAKDAGISTLNASDLTLQPKVSAAGFHQVVAKGLHQLQLARLRVLPTTDRGARLVWETDIQDVAGGRALATMSYVDAQLGTVLLRRDAVNTLAEGTGTQASSAASTTPGFFQGSYTPKACSPKVLLTGVAPGDQTLVASAAAASTPSDDITLRIYRNGTQVAQFDTLSSPEGGTVSWHPAITAADKVYAAVCPFDTSVAGGSYVGNYVSTDQSVPAVNLPGPLTDGTLLGPATWQAFASNPQLARDGVVSVDDRYKVCSGTGGATKAVGQSLTGCNYVYGTVGGKDGSQDFPSRLPYDADGVTGVASNSTVGNNAITTNAQLSSSLTPGAPFAPPNGGGTRDYGYAPLDTFTDQWHTAKCNPAALLTPPSANVNAAIINLFVGHNRIHDFAYRLGLTETRGALQISNFGKSGTDVAENDPELGNAQNAAATNNAFAVTNQATGPAAGVGLTGRDNANQITLQDGVPGITNQYLFQPIVGFYAPCTDGDLDASVFLHEYTHAVSNRLIAGPATGLSGQQGGSMGESWSDLDAIEYLNEFGLAGLRGEDPYALGAYATGDPKVGIRDYNLAPSRNPLNYSDFGFDTTGPEVHADGEVWNAVQMTVREALINKYNATYPYTNKALQLSCALGRTRTGTQGPTWNHCPGNRRYITYMYDAMINQANGAPSMVDMRDAELISVMMRDPKDYNTVYEAFASRGLGLGASSKSSDDLEPVPSFASNTAGHNAHVTFALKDAVTGKPVKGSVFVGMYTARCRPIATTLGGAKLDAKADVLQGSYALTVQAKGYGIQRFNVSYRPGTATTTLKLLANVASSASAPSVSGNGGALRVGRIIDDSEATNGAFAGFPVAGRAVTVEFANGKRTFQKLAFSSLHHPAAALPEGGGNEIEGRLLGIRAFDVQASGDHGKTWTTVYRSPADFFPANHPRATAPDLLLRTVSLPKPVTADAVRLVVRSNTCTGGPDFNHEQEDDPTNPSDCRSTATNTTQVTITEFEVFQAASTTGAVVIQPGKGTSSGGHLAATGGRQGLAVSGLGLLGLVSAGWVVRRRLTPS
ncbi:MAG: peptidase fungalysin [Frankiales bacterium]|nr:peptidase fungalysin [Frankiales bacterium]